MEPTPQVSLVAPKDHVRLTAVRLHVRSWARFSLSYLGRLHIAKQVLASSLYFHSSFMLPPEDVLDQVVECIYSCSPAGALGGGP
jgi:hypothetical protein